MIMWDRIPSALCKLFSNVMLEVCWLRLATMMFQAMGIFWIIGWLLLIAGMMSVNQSTKSSFMALTNR